MTQSPSLVSILSKMILSNCGDRSWPQPALRRPPASRNPIFIPACAVWIGHQHASRRFVKTGSTASNRPNIGDLRQRPVTFWPYARARWAPKGRPVPPRPATDRACRVGTPSSARLPMRTTGRGLTNSDVEYDKVLPPGRRRPPRRDTKPARGRTHHRRPQTGRVGFVRVRCEKN